MSKPLTIVMTALNEGSEPVQTLDSLYASCDPDLVSVVLIDDGSERPVALPDRLTREHDITLVRHDERLGGHVSRDEGVGLADSDTVMIVDAHTRFPSEDRKWADKLILHSLDNPTAILNPRCAYVDSNMRVEDSKKHECGASLWLVHPNAFDKTKDKSYLSAKSTLEGKWYNGAMSDQPFEVSCVMGANYVFQRDWYLRLHGLNGLMSWGTSEPFLSLKSWLFGGSCIAIPYVTTGHVFRPASPFATPSWHLTFNKLFVLSTLFTQDTADALLHYIPNGPDYAFALQEVARVNAFANAERTYYDDNRKHDIYWFIENHTHEEDHGRLACLANR